MYSMTGDMNSPAATEMELWNPIIEENKSEMSVKLLGFFNKTKQNKKT